MTVAIPLSLCAEGSKVMKRVGGTEYVVKREIVVFIEGREPIRVIADEGVVFLQHAGGNYSSVPETKIVYVEYTVDELLYQLRVAEMGVPK